MTVATKTYQNLIDGKWVGAASGATFERISPAHDVVVGRYPSAGTDDLERAVVDELGYERDRPHFPHQGGIETDLVDSV